jgi:hypothetical protein
MTVGGSASRVAATPDPCQATGERGLDGGVVLQIRSMHAILKPLLENPVYDAFWTARRETYVLLAARRVLGNRKQFYRLRAVAVISSAIVPSLVGLNRSGTGGVWVRWVTLALSLIAAVSTATIALFRFGDRWCLYRNLQSALLRCGGSSSPTSRSRPRPHGQPSLLAPTPRSTSTTAHRRLT